MPDFVPDPAREAWLRQLAPVGAGADLAYLLAALDAARAECGRVRDAAALQNYEIEDTLGRALAKACGFPENYPHVSALDDGSVCVGDHTAETLALAAAKRLAALEAGLRGLTHAFDGTDCSSGKRRCRGNDCVHGQDEALAVARRLLGER